MQRQCVPSVAGSSQPGTAVRVVPEGDEDRKESAMGGKETESGQVKIKVCL